LAKQAYVYGAALFDFAIFDDAPVPLMEVHMIYFVQKLTPVGLRMQYHAYYLVQRDCDQIVFEFPAMRFYGPCKLYSSLCVRGKAGYALVKGFNTIQDQYVWNGEAHCLELRNRGGIFAVGVTAHGVGDALIKGSWFRNIRAEFGCLHPEGGTVTQNLFQ
jgi:hypothetical protein